MILRELITHERVAMLTLRDALEVHVRYASDPVDCIAGITSPPYWLTVGPSILHRLTPA